MRKKGLFFLLLFIFIFATSCTHFRSSSSESNQRCVANDGAQCAAVFTSAPLDAQQISLRDQLLALSTDKSTQRKIVKAVDSLLPTIARLSEENKLKPVLAALAQKLLEAGKLPARFTKENLAENIELLTTMIEHQFIAKNFSKKSKHKYVSWLEASREIQKAAMKTAAPRRGPDSPSLLEDPIFIKELEEITDSKFRNSSNLKLLIDGPQAFPLKEKLIEEANESIYVMTWAFENDKTGWQFARQLAAKHKAGKDVRIIVDNKTARQAIYGTVPAWLKEQGVPIIQWKDPESPLYAFHKKAMIVDGVHLVDGGMNWGDVYSHMGPETTHKWRDTDFYAFGNAAIDTQQIFIETWNSQIDKNNLPFSKIITDSSKHIDSKNPQDALVMTVNHVPNPQAKDPILTSIIKGIEGASKEINIENAYFIENPAVYRALVRAMKRNVKVNIFTNSETSIDVPIIAKPILYSLDDLYRLGAQIYLKKGATLHSKFMTIDGVGSWIMSYNHHPQSMRIQGEIAHVILDKTFTRKLAAQFQTDVSTLATKITDVKMLQPVINLLDIILQRYFFDQL